MNFRFAGEKLPQHAPLLVLLLAGEVYPCTTFCLNVDGHVVFGANYDWDTGVGKVMVNGRYVTKASLTLRPAHWVSRFASITVNQFGRDFPTGGMNEAGLMVGIMDLDETQYPEVDERPSAGVLDWIQYQLDRSATTDEAVVNAAAIRIATGSRRVHYLVADRTGRAVTIEYLGGQLVVHRDASLPMALLTNSRYDDSLAYLQTISGFGGTRAVPAGSGSLERFARVASMVRNTQPGADVVDRAFAILDSASASITKWSLVYDATTATVYMRTAMNPSRRWVSFSSFDGSSASAVKTLDINGVESGDVAPFFGDYTSLENLALVKRAFDESPFVSNTSEAVRLQYAMHPEKDACAGGRVRAVRH